MHENFTHESKLTHKANDTVLKGKIINFPNKCHQNSWGCSSQQSQFSGKERLKESSIEVKRFYQMFILFWE